MKHKQLLKAFLVLVLVLTYLPVQPTYAATITVNTTSDVLDAAGSCSAVTIALLPGTDEFISLREAICAANNNSGPDTIEFDISGCGGVCTIQPSSNLPTLTDDGTTIDGYSQSGAVQATATTPAVLKIELDGTTNAGSSARGLHIHSSADNVIRGLVINRFGGRGVNIEGSGATGNSIKGNYIGTDASGTLDRGNAYYGVFIESGAQNNTVGGDTPAERNVISGNAYYGVLIAGGAQNNTVSGNYIGLAANGADALGNGRSGVFIAEAAQGNTIGGDAAGERNIISSNGWDGVCIDGTDTMSNTISGNYIGTDASGTADLGNNNGVYVEDSQNNTVGPGNVIAHNDYDGVLVYGSGASGNTITQNSIFSNTMGGINLTGGANGGIAAPVIITTTQGSVNIVGTACPGCTVEVFRNSDTDGEGETYIGHTTATAGGAFTLTVSSLSQPYLTATATDAISGTSKFSTVFASTVTGGNVYLPIIMRNH